MNKHLPLLFFLCITKMCSIEISASEDAEDSTNVKEQLILPDNKSSDKNKVNKGEKSSTKTGFYSGFNLGIRRNDISGRLTTKEDPEDVTSEMKSSRSNLNIDFSLGWDKNFGHLVAGCGASLGFNPSSEVEYSKKFKVADVSSGNEYALFAKLGFSFDRIMLYGKLGGGLYSYKYDWQVNNPPNEKRNNFISPIYGIGVEYGLSNNISLRAEFSSDTKKSIDELNVSRNNRKVEDSSGRAWQIKLGCSYRF